MVDVVLVGGVRTPIGRFGGSFKDLSARELGAIAIRAVVERTGVPKEEIDEVIFGCVGQIAEDAFIARTCAVYAGLPVTVPAYTVNRLCSSGLQAIVSAAEKIRAGEAEVIVAGGVEHMSGVPFYLREARWGYRLGNAVLEDGLVTLLSDPFQRYHMGMTAENVAERFGVSREDQDRFALGSQQKAVSAIQEGRFKDQIVAVEIKEKKEARIVDTDEHPRPETTLERLAALKPAFKEQGGTVTAGNSSGINDAAAAAVVMSSSKAARLGLKPQVIIKASSAVAIEPEIMGIAPVPATRKVLAKVGLSLDDIDLIELNEAFAAQAVEVMRQLDIDPDKLNVNGGAIALGHPVGATGCILTVKLIYEMQRRRARYGLVTLCVGGGQGLATIFENVT
ncbi:MAG: thiolase family protein [Chloroflexi bacterium]|nr:thiolase family protein [Chloroflexota bacterium]MCL5076185.1 thiolase family protein [Chloroflexota bacterium]